MKRYLVATAFIALTLFSCSPTERSVGFTNWSDDGTPYKFHLGTEQSISVVKKFDELLQSKNYDLLYEHFSDSATFTYHNNETLKWEPQNAFSVDLDPDMGGEHVNMLYLATYESEESKSQFYANLWFYVREGKIVTLRQFNQSIK
jgi:hypothetical protein